LGASGPADEQARARGILRVTGGALLLIFLAGLLVGPTTPVTTNPPGFANPVVALELATEPAQVFGILGRPDDPERAAAVRRMTVATVIDFPFLLAYSAFYVGIALLLRARGRLTERGARIVLALAIAMAAADAFENRELLALCGATDAGTMTPILGRLRAFTTLKWSALFVASAVVAAAIRRETGWWRWSAVPFGLAAALGVVALVHPPAIEWSLAPFGLAWTMVWVHALRAPRTRPGA
jgi:hypothetical protein